MPGMPPPASDERQTLLEFLRFNQNAFFAHAYGLTDDEYFWEPVAGCWTVHRDGAIDFAFPPPEPAPFRSTTGASFTQETVTCTVATEPPLSV